MTNSLIKKAVNSKERTRLIAQTCGGYQHEHYVFRTKLDRELAAEKEQRESRDQDAVAVAIETFEQLGQLGRETIRECVSNGVHLECQ